MDTFWLKIAAAAVAVVVAIVVVSMYLPRGPQEPQPPEKTIYDQWEQDDKKLTAEPQLKEPTEPVPSVPPPSEPALARPNEPTEPPAPQFKELSTEEDIEAQKLWIWAENQRKMGRLPGMGYGQMVKACRDIIQRWPQSKYAFLAKRALADLPERYQQMYNITKEEIDLGNLK